MAGMVLRWLSTLADALVEEGPGNQTRILAVAAALVTHANSDGTRCRPGIRLLARETGQHNGRVSEAMDWLIDYGWLTFDRLVAHRGRQRTGPDYS